MSGPAATNRTTQFLDGALKENARGQYSGAILSIIIADVAVFLAMNDRELPASVFGMACAASRIFQFESWRTK